MNSENAGLCCCEYFDIHQQRNHILACCCNCTDLDESFESLITGNNIPQQRKSAIMATIQDRMRIPWRGGAKQIALDAVLPIIVIPLILLIAATSLWWTIFAFSLMLFFLLYVSYHFMTSIPHTKFFFIWTCTSLVVLYLIFEFLVIPFLQILVEENVALSMLILGFILCAHVARVKNGYGNLNGKESDTEMGLGIRNKHVFCPICKAVVFEQDFHCVWLDTCINRNNQLFFILSLVFAEGALLYSSNLTLTSVCHPFNFYKTILLPDDCSEVYEQIELGLSFVSALYSLGIALAVLILLIQQILLISLGMSRNEWNMLPFSKKLLFGLTAHRPNNKGFLCNWTKLFQRPQHTVFSDPQ